jgi:type II secretion system protein G
VVTVRSRERGFTLLELIVVVAMIGILAAIVMPALTKMPTRAKEAVLKTNLHTLREVIDMYYGDEGHYPESLDALVEEDYLRAIPVDPFTRSAETWELIFEEEGEDGEPEPGPPPGPDEPAGPGIIDVRSGSPFIALDGTAYAEW